MSMRKGLALVLLASFIVMAFGAVVMAEGGMVTIDQPAEKFPAKKLKDGAKKKPPVTFNHEKHGADLGCETCHHKATAEDIAAKKVASCFTCHGPVAEEAKVDTYKMIHDKKIGKCLKCHKEKADAGNANAPTKCKGCHKK
jgi:hypothetical protein